MALLTDGVPVTIEDLRAHDGAVTDIASVEKINLAGKLSIAHEDVTGDIETFLREYAGGRAPKAGQVVVTSDVRRWVLLHTLALVYAEAYHSQLNDRYRGRWNQYARSATEARQRALTRGLAIVYAPLPKPAQPIVTLGAGAFLAGTYYFATSWVNEAGAESALGEPVGVTLADDQGLELVAVDPPSAARGWFVYGGSDVGAMRRQMETPVTVNESWSGGVLAIDGPAPAAGQSADYSFVHQQRIRRG